MGSTRQPVYPVELHPAVQGGGGGIIRLDLGGRSVDLLTVVQCPTDGL